MAGLGSRTVGKAFDAVTTEHVQLRALRDEIAALLAARPDRRWRKTLAARLEELSGRLAGHFALEEKAGLFEDLEEALPEAGRECARLRADHPWLLAHLEDLRDRLRAPEPKGGSEAIKASLRTFLEELARHEERENALLTRAAEDDELGAVD
jgi:hypothetical protein